MRGRQFGVFKAYSDHEWQLIFVKGHDRAKWPADDPESWDKRLQSVTADQALNVALEGTGYQLGERGGLTKVNKTNFTISALVKLLWIIRAFNCNFVYGEFVENRSLTAISIYIIGKAHTLVCNLSTETMLLKFWWKKTPDNGVLLLLNRGKVRNQQIQKAMPLVDMVEKNRGLILSGRKQVWQAYR